MLKKIIAATVISTGLAISAIGDASADDHRKKGGYETSRSTEWGQANYSYKEHGYQNARRKVVVERKIRRRIDGDTLPLRRLLDLDRSYNGYRVKSVAIKIKPNGSYGRIKLLVNGQVVDRERIDGEKWITLRTDDDKTIGRDLKTLRLGVRGNVYIKNIQVSLAKPAYKRRGDVRGHTRKHVSPKVTVINTNHVEDPIARIFRIILKDINHSRPSF